MFPSYPLEHMQVFPLVLGETNHQIFVIPVLEIFISLWPENLLDSIVLSIQTAYSELLPPAHTHPSPRLQLHFHPSNLLRGVLVIKESETLLLFGQQLGKYSTAELQSL